MPVTPARRRHRARHARQTSTGSPALAGVLGLVLAGGTGGLALASGADRTTTSVALATSTQTLPSVALDLRAENLVARASRDRPAVPDLPATESEPDPAPEPPVPVLPGCEDPPATGYRNGRIPASELCRLPGTNGQSLRADAARAFVLLGQAYEAETGREICLTDSYRSYESQARLRWAKRGLAAPAGTSNHGSGIAVDMCGGVESFGTAAHRWMRNNAGRFGWVHPSWAGPRGKRPEPWHWEYRP